MSREWPHFRVLVSLLGAVALPSLCAAETLLVSGSLRAAEAEYFSVPPTESWQVQLKWLIEEGSRVELGQSVARLDPGSLQDELDEAESSLSDRLEEREISATSNQLARLDLELALARARAEFEKAEIDAAIPGDVMGGKDYRERQLEMRRRVDALRAAERELLTHDVLRESTRASEEIQLEQLRENITRYRSQLESLDIRATREGIVVHGEHPWFGRKFRQGDQVEMGFVLASIPNLDTLEVLAWAMEPELPALEPGQRASLRLDAYSTRQFQGRIMSVGISGQKRMQWGESPYFPVRIRIEDADTTIMRPGMSVSCRIDLGPPGEVE